MREGWIDKCLREICRKLDLKTFPGLRGLGELGLEDVELAPVNERKKVKPQKILRKRELLKSGCPVRVVAARDVGSEEILRLTRDLCVVLDDNDTTSEKPVNSFSPRDTRNVNIK